jgi:hypothetical protein
MFFAAAAACVIALSSAAERRKSYWNGCIKVATVTFHQIFSNLTVIKMFFFLFFFGFGAGIRS